MNSRKNVENFQISRFTANFRKFLQAMLMQIHVLTFLYFSL